MSGNETLRNSIATGLTVRLEDSPAPANALRFIFTAMFWPNCKPAHRSLRWQLMRGVQHRDRRFASQDVFRPPLGSEPPPRFLCDSTSRVVMNSRSTNKLTLGC